MAHTTIRHRVLASLSVCCCCRLPEHTVHADHILNEKSSPSRCLAYSKCSLNLIEWGRYCLQSTQHSAGRRGCACRGSLTLSRWSFSPQDNPGDNSYCLLKLLSLPTFPPPTPPKSSRRGPSCLGDAKEGSVTLQSCLTTKVSHSEAPQFLSAARVTVMK